MELANENNNKILTNLKICTSGFTTKKEEFYQIKKMIERLGG
jgi:hypothetical protein